MCYDYSLLLLLYYNDHFYIAPTNVMINTYIMLIIGQALFLLSYIHSPP